MEQVSFIDFIPYARAYGFFYHANTFRENPIVFNFKLDNLGKDLFHDLKTHAQKKRKPGEMLSQPDGRNMRWLFKDEDYDSLFAGTKPQYQFLATENEKKEA